MVGKDSTYTSFDAGTRTIVSHNCAGMCVGPAAGAESDGDLDAPRPAAAATGAARPDGAAPADEAVLARPAATSPRHLLDSPSTSVSATLSNSSSIASEKNDEPKATGVAAELVSKLAPGPA